MKQIKTLSTLFLLAIILSSCGVHSTLVTNTNSNATNVELSKKNFTILDQVSGESSANYIMGIGGLSNKALIENAKADMLKKANLLGGSKALVNVTIESHYSAFYIFYFKKTVTISAHIVEFTE